MRNRSLPSHASLQLPLVIFLEDVRPELMLLQRFLYRLYRILNATQRLDDLLVYIKVPLHASVQFGSELLVLLQKLPLGNHLWVLIHHHIVWVLVH